MGARMDWQAEGHDWPHRSASRFVDAGGLRWHVQQFTAADRQAPVALLIHGTGASTHSWRTLAPLLRAQFQVLTVDLPGHAFTGMPPQGPTSARLSLPGMARALSALLSVIKTQPALVVGHSAGAAIAVRMCLDGLLAPRMVAGLNGALVPLGGVAGRLFSPAAKLLAAVPLVPRVFARRAGDPAVLRRLLDGTGSTLDAQGVALYGRLVRNPGHAAGALGMMANWDLAALWRDLPALKVPLVLVVGANDTTVPPQQASQVLAAVRGATLTTLPSLGHLAHEERADLVAQVVCAHYGALSGTPSGRPSVAAALAQG